MKLKHLKKIKKTIHLIYPFDLRKNINPWSIGNNIYYSLKDKFEFNFYSWTSIEKIIPKEGDILIGHAHTNPYTVFRRSIDNSNWNKKILLQPYNEDPKQMCHLYDLIPKCDLFISICGSYWFNRVKKSPFKSWKPKMLQLDLGLDRKEYPFFKKNINKKFNRKFIYIGNDYSYNNFAKNTNYLKNIINKMGSKNFASAGNKKIADEKFYGWLDFTKKSSLQKIKNYDFLIHVSKNDANPSIILEAISWGLIPIITKGCGYDEFSKKLFIPNNQTLQAVKKIKKFQEISNKTLIEIQKENLNILKKKFNWKRFRNTIRQAILKKKLTKSEIDYSKKEIKFFKFYTKESPNYYLKQDILFSVIKSNLKRFFYF